jgi:hypothetical protein
VSAPRGRRRGPGLARAELREKRALRARVAIIADQLEVEELEVMVLLGDRLLAGQNQYAPLDLAADQRDFPTEILFELVDQANYSAMEILRRRKRHVAMAGGDRERKLLASGSSDPEET